MRLILEGGGFTSTSRFIRLPALAQMNLYLQFSSHMRSRGPWATLSNTRVAGPEAHGACRKPRGQASPIGSASKKQAQVKPNQVQSRHVSQLWRGARFRVQVPSEAVDYSGGCPSVPSGYFHAADTRAHGRHERRCLPAAQLPTPGPGARTEGRSREASKSNSPWPSWVARSV